MKRLSTALTLLTMLAAVAAASSQPDAVLHASLAPAAWPCDEWIDMPGLRAGGERAP